jgi:hypothetical protein
MGWNGSFTAQPYLRWPGCSSASADPTSGGDGRYPSPCSLRCTGSRAAYCNRVAGEPFGCGTGRAKLYAWNVATLAEAADRDVALLRPLRPWPAGSARGRRRCCRRRRPRPQAPPAGLGRRAAWQRPDRCPEGRYVVYACRPPLQPPGQPITPGPLRVPAGLPVIQVNCQTAAAAEPVLQRWAGRYRRQM